MGYEVLWEPRGVVKRFHGVVSHQDMVRAVIETEADARFDSLRFVINDFRDLLQLDCASEVVEEISTMDLGASRTNPRIRIAVVSTSAEVIEMATAYANSDLNVYPTRIFASMAEARAWLVMHDDFGLSQW